jgi:hypothetical protein
METGPQGVKNHVKSRHKDEYAIGLRLTGVGNPRHWTEATIADIRSIQRADNLEKAEAEHVEIGPITGNVLTPDCGPQATHDQIYDLVKDLTLGEASKLFHAVLHLKVEDQSNKFQEMLDHLSMNISI